MAVLTSNNSSIGEIDFTGLDGLLEKFRHENPECIIVGARKTEHLPCYRFLNKCGVTVAHKLPNIELALIIKDKSTITKEQKFSDDFYYIEVHPLRVRGFPVEASVEFKEFRDRHYGIIGAPDKVCQNTPETVFVPKQKYLLPGTNGSPFERNHFPRDWLNDLLEDGSTNPCEMSKAEYARYVRKRYDCTLDFVSKLFEELKANDLSGYGEVNKKRVAPEDMTLPVLSTEPVMGRSFIERDFQPWYKKAYAFAFGSNTCINHNMSRDYEITLIGAELCLFVSSFGFGPSIASLSVKEHRAYSLLMLPIAYLGTDLLCRLRRKSSAGIIGSAYEHFYENTPAKNKLNE
ncbi:hypothetical protein HY486_04310 [Candidatus Woesearchaeota archaeon]|nr:hypothetical protein [Candidatus Woesearchaeota archaeon]